MKYVLDANVALKCELPETDSPKALRIRDEYRRHQIELLAPDVFPVEVANALVRSERQNILTPVLGAAALRRTLTLLPTLHPSWPLLPRAYEIASRARIGVYDCLYVALAEAQQCQLLTADQRLLNVLSRDFPFLTSLSSLP